MPALDDTRALLEVLEVWAERGWVRQLDAAFARFLAQEAPGAPALLILAAALASHQLGRGHACLDLAATLRDPALALSLPPDGLRRADEASVPLPGELLAGLDLAAWLAALRAPALLADGDGATPLVLRGHRLYLRRYWHYERAVRRRIDLRLDTGQEAPDPAASRTVLDRLFPSAGDGSTDWQKLACALAARARFAVVTGGPGTGKTTTVVRLLALLQAAALAPAAAAAPLRIRLAAPTGKAAARLNASIAGAVARLPLAGLAQAEDVRAHIPTDVTTLHRLLGSRPDTRRFRHHAGNPLALDVLVVDEASMIDLEMMAAVLDALPPRARLVLLGDKDQLASVEAGAVLGELCARAERAHYTPATAAWLEAATGQPVPDALLDPQGMPIDQAIAMLRHSHRFSASSGIGRLAEAVNAGRVRQVESVLRHGHADLDVIAVDARQDEALARLVIDGAPAAAPPAPAQGELFAGPRDTTPHAAADAARAFGYRHYLGVMREDRPAAGTAQSAWDDWARAVLAAHGRFQLLCALRRGPWGVEGLNRRIARILLQAGLIDADDGWYAGRPVLVTRNDYGLGLMNGDIGITLAVPGAAHAPPALRVAFPGGAGGDAVRWVLPSRLQDVETVYALTVHKSQGSEFDHTAFALPEQPNPILTRELVYTAITRARRHFTLLESGPRHLLGFAVERRVVRASGLMQDEHG
ncbi:exodeoxyribonuclease V subunit alpha [Verticiella sediminum]|uniref:RecBCD enzyme subunit RecD n=2 Tax=Verticiella sediminum TaxID=1247510 RepID=A0A556AZ40_9BURK|nr:exodeoxyribonuclease V subunit alpha [Verticiella sediminum]